MLSQLFVVVATVAVAYALLILLRRPIRRFDRLTSVTCPNCGTNPARVHRGFITKAFSQVLPLRSYRCMSCKRRFVRVKPLTEKIGAEA